MRLILTLLVLGIAAGLAALAFRPRAAEAATLKVGDDAPGFSTDAVTGEQTIPVHLVDYRGRLVVLYFYPKDNTPGCTREACGFRDGYDKLQNWGITVFGCSIDGADSHRAFAKKYRLPFPLLLDPDKKIAKAYGADNGIPILGLDKRITYVIGENGRIVAVYPRVDPATHANQIIHDLGADHPRPATTATPTSTPEAPPSSLQLNENDLE
ncbi:MAG TPA: peroxiredoxin [Candidatus Binataceae bacterium]|nr:peroxiredoxin [Candidatus Binataceae bacterium]